MKFFLIAITSIFGLVVCSFLKVGNDGAAVLPVCKTEYVIIAIIDGPRFTETYGDTTCTHIPNLGKKLRFEGTLFTNFRNEGPTFTNSGHTAITTGVHQNVKNNGKELPKMPSMFQYFLKEKNLDKSQAYIVSSKGKLEVLANTKNKEWWNMYMPSTYCGTNGLAANYGDDAQTLNKVLELYGSPNPPKLMLINFLAVDSYGHAKRWDDYLRAIKDSDGYIDRIWTFVQNNPKLKDKTTLIVTHDHGRHLDGHKDGFVSHGDGCEGCRHIALLGLGPDFKKNNVIEKGGELRDISKTVGYLLKFNIPTSEGRVLTEMFQNIPESK